MSQIILDSNQRYVMDGEQQQQQQPLQPQIEVPHQHVPAPARWVAKLARPKPYSGDKPWLPNQDVRDWTERMLIYCDGGGAASDAAKFEHFRCNVEGPAAVWFRSRLQGPAESFTEFLAEFIAAFDNPMRVQHARDRLRRLMQRGPVTAFNRLWRAILLEIGKANYNESAMLDDYLHRLRPELAAKVAAASPVSLEAAMKTAETVDEITWRYNPAKVSNNRSAAPAAAHDPYGAAPMDLGGMSASEPALQQMGVRKPVTCWNCGMIGHPAKKCKRPLSAECKARLQRLKTKGQAKG